jgi:hypothetical protein
LIIGHHFSISALWNAAKAAGIIAKLNEAMVQSLAEADVRKKLITKNQKFGTFSFFVDLFSYREPIMDRPRGLVEQRRYRQRSRVTCECASNPRHNPA